MISKTNTVVVPNVAVEWNSPVSLSPIPEISEIDMIDYKKLSITLPSDSPQKDNCEEDGVFCISVPISPVDEDEVVLQDATKSRDRKKDEKSDDSDPFEKVLGQGNQLVRAKNFKDMSDYMSTQFFCVKSNGYSEMSRSRSNETCGTVGERRKLHTTLSAPAVFGNRSSHDGDETKIIENCVLSTDVSDTDQSIPLQEDVSDTDSDNDPKAASSSLMSTKRMGFSYKKKPNLSPSKEGNTLRSTHSMGFKDVKQTVNVQQGPLARLRRRMSSNQ